MIEFNRSITNVNHFSDRLRQARVLRGMSQAALARASGVSQGAISNYENGTRRSAKEIFRLAEALGVSPIWLSTGTEPMQASTADRYVLEESERQSSQRYAWPFSSITASTFWSLEPDERAFLESALAAMIGTFLKKPRK